MGGGMAHGDADVSLWRLYLMRVLYALMAFALGAEQWSCVIGLDADAPLMTGIAHSLFAALAVVALLGIRYPLQMLPVLFFEFLWKLIWLCAVALRFSLEGRLNPDFMGTVWSCLPGLVIPFVIPWRYVIANYAGKPGDRWR